MHRSSLFAIALILAVGCTPAEEPSPAPSPAAASKPRVPPTRPGRAPMTPGEIPSRDGIVIRYFSFRPPERENAQPADAGKLPTLVFVHGWCCNLSFWQSQMEYFSLKYPVIMLDLAGHGVSRGTRDRWTMEAFGHDVAAVVNDVGADRVILIGHSMGGPVILEAAHLLGDKVVGIVPVDAFTDPNESYTADQMAELRKPFEDKFSTAMREALHHKNDFFSEATTDDLKERITQTMTSASPQMGVGAFQGMLEFANDRQRPLMQEMKKPFVCINAQRVEEKVADGRQHAPQFEVIALPNSGHFLMMEHPDEFNALLEKTIEAMLAN